MNALTESFFSWERGHLGRQTASLLSVSDEPRNTRPGFGFAGKMPAVPGERRPLPFVDEERYGRNKSCATAFQPREYRA